jgi:hypothetical protein
MNPLEQEPRDQESAQLKEQCDGVRTREKSAEFLRIQVVIEDHHQGSNPAQSIQAGYFALR